MKNAIEHRLNGALIVKTRRPLSVPQYHVFKRGHGGEGELVPSPNGPWDYLDNARKDADEPEAKE
ncbi:hypothetical protein [Oceanospirillum phage vB_OsaM_PD0307]|nr:hypothetical protein [Oceanospirillum phage vB_OsaM_PD0307]